MGDIMILNCTDLRSVGRAREHGGRTADVVKSNSKGRTSKLVDNEVSKTIILNNLAEDYDIACKIHNT